MAVLVNGLACQAHGSRVDLGDGRSRGIGRVGGKGIAGQALGTGLQIFEVELTNELWAGEIEGFVEVILLGDAAGKREQIRAQGTIGDQGAVVEGGEKWLHGLLGGQWGLV